ncbi:MAG: hypothetical protein EOO43_08040 [Flavobacterium sp.]|nr:MAG: hypothetical protein EOO43_08040 [Flavobacterium sp.]
MAVASALQGLSDCERQDLFLNILIAHTNTTEHPSSSLKWLADSVDSLHGYEVSNQQLEHLQELELNKDFSEFFESRLYHLLNYEENSAEWQSKLKKIIFHLIKTKEDFLNPEEFRYKYDAAFITALYSPEFEAVLALSSNWTQIIHHEDPAIYYEADIEFEGKSKKILAAYADQMGMVACAAISMKVVMKFRPKYIFLTGISAGIKNKNVNYGDILVADFCWDYNSGKITQFKVDAEDEGVTVSHMKFEAEPRYIPLRSSLKNKFLQFVNDKDILHRIKTEWGGQPHPHELAAFIGPLASGSNVVASSLKMNEIKGQNRKLIGIEMEAYALYYVCTQIFESKIIPIVIKSICDFGDEEKDDKYQKYSAYTSVQFSKHFLFKYL